MPKVSVITPSYSPREKQYFLSALSLENQTSKDFEWIIVGDGKGSDVINTYLQGKIELDVVLNRNYGPSVARNVGFQIASGDIITYLDLGDELAPNRIENIIRLFNDYECDLLFSAYNIVQEGKFTLFDHFNWLGNHSRYPTAFEYIQLLQYQNISTPLGVAHTRAPFVQAGGFQRGIVCGEDGVLWRRMLQHILSNKVLFSNDVAGNYYVLPDSQARTQRRFEMGGFAINGDLKDNGRYLDEDWYKNYKTEEDYYDR